jgi:hypothetical protein
VRDLLQRGVDLGLRRNPALDVPVTESEHRHG